MLIRKLFALIFFIFTFFYAIQIAYIKEEDISPTMGGYVYFPQTGQIRLNFKVNGNDLRKNKQLNIAELFSEWKDWLKTHESSLSDDYPVLW
ncbi:MAG: hypothetical protein COB02_00405 [Candidatus Cloacimonadota bacterium]|nr:MAG: hypothetical protein COB02_00405 [Candidatus Cloacimonadota bacterium]